MKTSESITEVATALNAVQAELQPAMKGSENPYFHSKYADLLAVWNACREPLTKHGLSVSQVGGMDEHGPYLETILMHTSGQYIAGKLPLMAAKADPQAQGSAITYARRYSLSAIVGLCTEEDDDAEAATQHQVEAKAKPAVKPAAKPVAMPASVVAGLYSTWIQECPLDGEAWKDDQYGKSHKASDGSYHRLNTLIRDEVQSLFNVLEATPAFTSRVRDDGKTAWEMTEVFKRWLLTQDASYVAWTKISEGNRLAILYALRQKVQDIPTENPLVQAAIKAGGVKTEVK